MITRIKSSLPNIFFNISWISYKSISVEINVDTDATVRDVCIEWNVRRDWWIPLNK